MGKTHRIKGFAIKKSGIEIKLDMSRIEKNVNRAQYALDSAVMTSMVPYMPMQTGTFINATQARSQSLAGSGEVVAAISPTGRFLYEGKVMVDEKTLHPWARPGAKKLVTDRKLAYSTHAHPKAQSHWFEPAKENDLKNWVKILKKEVGKE